MLEIIILIIFITIPAAVIDQADVQVKCDAPLVQRIFLPHKQDTGDEIRVVGECVLPLTTRLCQVLCDSGVTFLTVSGSCFIARGNAAQIRKLASLRLIKSLRLSVIQSKPNAPNDDIN